MSKKIIRKFPLTKNGCKEAIKWLRSIGEYDRVHENTGSDGWSITDAANYLYERMKCNGS